MKIVNKPWGYEKWIGEGRSYFLKEIFIKAGFKTSLQYHEFKEETNFIVSGECILTMDNEKFSLGSNESFHILPRVVHRVEAILDLTMVEASTTELDDIIRVEDDWNRGNGKIESEHR